jgi:hypothetical protein
MTNLLPQQSLGRARSFYRGHFILTGSLILTACGLFSLLALVPAYTILRAGHIPAEASGASPSQARIDESERQSLDETRIVLLELKPVASSTVSFVGVLGDVLNVRPSGIAITNIIYTPGDPGTIVLSGTSASRDATSKYRTTLLDDPRFTSVSVPIGALAGVEGGHFTVTLTGAF